MEPASTWMSYAKVYDARPCNLEESLWFLLLSHLFYFNRNVASDDCMRVRPSLIRSVPPFHGIEAYLAGGSSTPEKHR